MYVCMYVCVYIYIYIRILIEAECGDISLHFQQSQHLATACTGGSTPFH